MDPYRTPESTDDQPENRSRFAGLATWIAEGLFAEPITALATIMLTLGAVRTLAFWLLVQMDAIPG